MQRRGSYSDALTLRPALWGMVIDLKELLKTWNGNPTPASLYGDSLEIVQRLTL
jgi:hypothetical protein